MKYINTKNPPQHQPETTQNHKETTQNTKNQPKNTKNHHNTPKTHQFETTNKQKNNKRLTPLIFCFVFVYTAFFRSP
jgi:hypothetical protein